MVACFATFHLPALGVVHCGAAGLGRDSNSSPRLGFAFRSDRVWLVGPVRERSHLRRNSVYDDASLRSSYPASGNRYADIGHES